MYIDASNLDRFSQDGDFGVLRRIRAETGVNARIPLSGLHFIVAIHSTSTKKRKPSENLDARCELPVECPQPKSYAEICQGKPSAARPCAFALPQIEIRVRPYQCVGRGNGRLPSPSESVVPCRDVRGAECDHPRQQLGAMAVPFPTTNARPRQLGGQRRGIRMRSPLGRRWPLFREGSFGL
jgi:hypothetical protein